MMIAALLAVLALGAEVQAPRPPATAEQLVACTDESGRRDDSAIIAACTAVLEAGNTDETTRLNALSHRARAYDRLFDYRHALPDFREAARIAPRNPRLLNGLCWSLAVLGESLDEALAACNAALEDSPGNPAVLDSRGLVELKQGRFQEAWNDYNAAVQTEPRGLSWLYGRGIAAIRLGREAEGRADLAAAEAAYPSIAAMYERYGIRP
ncbi:MAG TPA: tetratricopeptide repeat protein [Allosphingosinicella sp.]|jgi:Flp pilus assembly protein TadD|nr:tetratricopeptide repeat protein [Allosphingosinicella sp.]